MRCGGAFLGKGKSRSRAPLSPGGQVWTSSRPRGKQRHFVEIRKGFPPAHCSLPFVVSYIPFCYHSLRLLNAWVAWTEHRDTTFGAYRCARRDYSQSQNTMLGQENEELSPFVIPQEDVEVLNASEAFCMLRNYLARDTRYAWCCPSSSCSAVGWPSPECVLTPHQLLRAA